MRCLQSYNVTKLVEYICVFLGNPRMYKIKDEGIDSLYGVQIISDTINEKKFIICKCHRRIEEKCFLKDLPWYVLQTRTIGEKKSEYENIPKQYLDKNNGTMLSKINVNIKEQKQDIVEYGIEKCPCVNISLLNASNHAFRHFSSLEDILESFDSVIYINKEKLNI